MQGKRGDFQIRVDVSSPRAHASAPRDDRMGDHRCHRFRLPLMTVSVSGLVSSSPAIPPSALPL